MLLYNYHFPGAPHRYNKSTNAKHGKRTWQTHVANKPINLGVSNTQIKRTKQIGEVFVSDPKVYLRAFNRGDLTAATITNQFNHSDCSLAFPSFYAVAPRRSLAFDTSDRS